MKNLIDHKYPSFNGYSPYTANFNLKVYKLKNKFDELFFNAEKGSKYDVRLMQKKNIDTCKKPSKIGFAYAS